MSITLDPVVNFGKVSVSTTYDAAALTVVLASGHGALLPAPATDGAFNLIWWNSTAYPDPADDPNKEIVRVTARTTDTLTVTRAQEGTSASTKNTGGSTYKMILGATKKLIDDISAKVESVLTPTAVKTSAYNAVVNDMVLCDISGGSFEVTLPTEPADKSRIQIQTITVGGGYVLEIKAGGSDVFERAAGATSLYISLNQDVVSLQYQTTGAIWHVVNTAKTSNFATGFSGIDAITPITNADISINTISRVLTITPPLGYFNIFVDGGGRIVKYRKTGNVTFDAFTNTSGIWYFYFDSTGTPVTTQTAWTVADFSTTVPVYRLLWNATLYNFTVTSANVVEGDTYTDSVTGKVFTIRQTYTGATTIKTSGTGDPDTSYPGTLNRTTGTGDATLTYSAWTVAPRLVAQYVEYHLNDIPADTHAWMHLNGVIWSTGFTMANNAKTSGTPAADGSNTVIALSTGTNIDDNLEYTVTNDSTPSASWQQDLGDTTPATLTALNSALTTVFRQNAAGLVTFRDETRFPFDWSVVTNLPNYITSTGVRTPVSNGYFFVNFIYATQNPTAGTAIKIVSATTEFSNITNARAYIWTDIQNTYPFLGLDGEIRPLYRLIHEYRSSYDVGAKKSVLRETQDLRKAAVTSTTAATGSIPASSVTLVTPSGMTATNVQSGIQELYTNSTTAGFVKATYLQAAAADLGAADVEINLSNTNGSYITNLTTDGKITAGSFFLAASGATNTIDWGNGDLILSVSDGNYLDVTGGIYTDVVRIGSYIYPDTNDGATLGTSSDQFSDLYLASGATINYDNGNVIMTHTSGILTIGTGTLKITTPTNTATSVVTIDGAQTLSSKRINPRVVTTTDDATAVIDVDATDTYELSAIANATEFTVTGTPANGQKLIIRLKDAGVTKGLTWTGFTAIGVTLPTTTVAGKWHYVGCTYNSAASAWHAIAVGVQA